MISRQLFKIMVCVLSIQKEGYPAWIQVLEGSKTKFCFSIYDGLEAERVVQAMGKKTDARHHKVICLCSFAAADKWTRRHGRQTVAQHWANVKECSPKVLPCRVFFQTTDVLGAWGEVGEKNSGRINIFFLRKHWEFSSGLFLGQFRVHWPNIYLALGLFRPSWEQQLWLRGNTTPRSEK